MSVIERQQRERAVPCVWCMKPTWAVEAVCEKPSCQEREANR